MCLLCYCMCSGFWEAYEHVRDFVHAILRRELVRNPTTVFFTGHSLGACTSYTAAIVGLCLYVHVLLRRARTGGALATFAALDVTLHTVPRVNAWLKHQEK